MRSVDVYSFYIAYASVKERKGDRLFLRDPANARDVPAGPLVAPPRVVASQKSHVASQTVTAGGFRTISEVQNFAKRRLRRTTSDHSQPLLGMKWVVVKENSSDLGHYFLPSPG